MKAVAIYPDPKGLAALEQALSLRTDIQLCRSFDQVPDADTICRVLRAWAPSIVFVDITVPQTEALNGLLAKEFPELRRVAIHPAQIPDVFRRVLHLGMRELINPPFRPATLNPVLDRLLLDLQRNPIQTRHHCPIWAFLPGKAGAGASTIAAHTSWAVAEDREARVLLADFDRHSGITAFQFNVNPEYTLQDALANSLDLDEESWRRLVKSVRNVDLLLSKPGVVADVNLDRFVADLLEFAQRNYTSIHLDLPDTLDTQTLAVLHHADQIFLVATPEIASLRMAKLKADALRKLDLEGRTHLVLNRFTNKITLSDSDISDAVGLNVFASFPSEYEAVTESLRTARPAQRILKAAHDLLEAAGQANRQRRRSLLDRLGLPLSSLRAQPTPSVLRS